ncbi:HU family DNA-binding protein [Ampullimonas aquatilis]|uniref:HU family DNA-binding protein n=1 Tax=Ampullimonas aquatilis TaxID=1341549 RepID=UPI003C717794
MTQTELIIKLIQSTDLSKKQIDHLLKVLGVTIQHALLNDDEVTLPGVGKLGAKRRGARVGRNPATGQQMTIAARKAAVFTPIKALKAAINP